MATYTLNGDALNASVSIDEPYAPISLVTNRFNELAEQGNQVLDLLIGEEGDGGLLGEMEASLGTAPTADIEAKAVDTSIILDESGLTLPTFTGTLVAVPTVDVDFTGIDLPEEISVALAWAEATLPTEVYDALKTQILADLVDGSTGITEEVEIAIYTRARNRQQAANLAEYNKLVEAQTQLQHALPTGVYASTLADYAIGQARQEADLEASIVETQAKLAQENRKSAIQGAIALHQILVQIRDGESNRNLDGAKALLQGELQEYSEKIKAFQAVWDGKKAEVQAKAEGVRAAVDTNKGLIEVYTAEVQGFGEAEKAIAARNESRIKVLEQLINEADLDLRAQIAEANALVSSYTAETSIKERIASDRAQVASHCAIGLLSAANVSASLGYSGSEQSSKGFHVQVSGNESHNYQEV